MQGMKEHTTFAEGSSIAGGERLRSRRIREKIYKEENEHEKTTLATFDIQTEYIDMCVIVRPNCNQLCVR